MVGAFLLSAVVFLSVPLFSGDDQVRDVMDMSRAVAYEVDQRFSQLSLEEKVGMVLMPAFDVHDTPELFVQRLCDVKAGGFIIIQPQVTREIIQVIRDGYHACNQRTALLVAIDAEPGLISKKISIETQYAAMLETHTSVENTARHIAKALSDMHIDVAFAPTFDSNTNKDIIGYRSFGRSFDEVVPKALLFSEILSRSSIITAAKHFPGHGTVSGDSHKNSVHADGSLPELSHFRAAVRAGIPMVMIGHITVHGGAYDTGGLPASLSPRIGIDALRTDLGFSGVVVSDALNMKAVTEYKDAPLRALMSGVDIVVMPEDVTAAYRAIYEQALRDAATANRLDEAVRSILALRVRHVVNYE